MRRGGSNRTSPMTLVLPVCIAIIILVIIVKAFMGGSTTKDGRNESAGTAYAQVVPKADAKVSIYMSSDAQSEIKGPSKLYPNDKMVRVDSGDADIQIDGSTSTLSIESLSEVHYDGVVDGKQSFTVGNGYAWVESPNGDLTINLKLFKVTPDKGSIVIVSQNTRSSTVYVLKGNVTAATDSSSATVGVNQMLSLLLSEAKTANLSDKVAALEDFIKQTSIFNKKDGASILSSVTGSSDSGSTIVDGSGSTGSGTSSVSKNSKPVSFTYPEDGMTVDTTTINIEGTINDSTVSKILIGKREAQLNKTDKTFQLKDYELTDVSNDIAYKVYDDAGVVVDKNIITVNVSGKKASSTIKKPDVVNYPVSNKDFKIVSPAENPYKTTETSVKLKGSFAPNIVKYIKVNNYQLQQFKAFGTSWTYNASIDNGNMEEGVNEYLITYYGPSDEVLATSKVYIVKESAQPETTTPTTATPSEGTGSGSTKPSL